MSVSDGRFELEQAIVNNELVLHYQPIVTLAERRIVAVEALVRWRHPTRGILPPAQFVPALERAGLARELTLWVLREAILQSTVWRNDREPLAVGVDLSPENLRDAHFRRFLDITLRAVGGPELLIAELPVAALTSPEQVESLILMRQKKIRVAVDDVVGPTELGDVPADIVKVGRGLVARLLTDEQARQDLTAIAASAKAHRRQIIAVGVQDERVWPLLAEVGCDLMQGFGVSPPLSTADLDHWRRRH